MWTTPLPPSPLDARRGFLLLAIGAFIVAGLLAYQAASNEITGQAIYHKRTGYRSSKAVLVTRQNDPDKFHKVTNFRWGISILCLSVAAVSFTLFRKLDD